jgi:hypothetical protein
MNDSDFELLARRAAASVMEHGWKPQTLPTETWLRMRALELAIETVRESTIEYVVYVADAYLKFLKGEST